MSLKGNRNKNANLTFFLMQKLTTRFNDFNFRYIEKEIYFHTNALRFFNKIGLFFAFLDF